MKPQRQRKFKLWKIVKYRKVDIDFRGGKGGYKMMKQETSGGREGGVETKFI